MPINWPTVSLDTTRGDSVSATAGGGAWLLVVVGRGDLRTYPLPAAGELVIGRDPDCDITLDHDRVSRRHARIGLAAGGESCVVVDLASRNGTRVGTQLAPNAPHVLRAGDAIGIGPFTMIVVREPAAEPPGALEVIDPTARTPVLESIAASGTSVLLRGESGTGKQVLAETIHALSGRAGKLVAINCAAIGGELLESELFGHERGAFTGAVAAKPGLFELAGGGTVLLDEIGDMPAALQAKLLRAVESRELVRVGGTVAIPIRARFVAATHRDLLAAVEAGEFRLDLYYRLAAITLTLPPLRERRSRIVPLARELLAGAAALSPAAAAKLHNHDYPGNVRELRNVLDRARVLSGGATIDEPHVVFDTPASKPEPEPAALAPDEEAERQRILDALARCNGNQTRAAKELGMARSTLTTKLSILRIPRPRK